MSGSLSITSLPNVKLCWSSSKHSGNSTAICCCLNWEYTLWFFFRFVLSLMCTKQLTCRSQRPLIQHQTLPQCRFNVGPASETAIQHWVLIDLTLSARGTDFRRQNLTSIDVRIWRILTSDSKTPKTMIYRSNYFLIINCQFMFVN